METSPQDSAAKKDIASFVDAAKLFSEAVLATHCRQEWCANVLKHLSHLYCEALALPPPDDIIDKADSERVTSEEFWQVFYHVFNILGDDGGYSVVLGQGDKQEIALIHIADDLADIYRDIQDGLRTLQKNPEHQDAVLWDLRFSYQKHWGKHAVGAMRVLHCVAFQTLWP